MLNRRRLLRLSTSSLLAAAGISVISSNAFPAFSQNAGSSVLVQWLGNMCFLFTGGGRRILVNPFRTLGCTAGYRLPKVEADLVLISSQLWDEGAAEDLPGNPKVLYDAGVYEIAGFKLQGIRVDHDREGGRRFGNNVAWRWSQGGINILHLGGAAAPIELEQKILMGTPDLALVPVGGGPKAFNPEEAKSAMDVLKPKVLIPTQYLTAAADKSACELVAVDQFLQLVEDMNIRRINSNQLRISQRDLPAEGTVIRVLSDRQLLA